MQEDISCVSDPAPPAASRLNGCFSHADRLKAIPASHPTLDSSSDSFLVSTL